MRSGLLDARSLVLAGQPCRIWTDRADLAAHLQPFARRYGRDVERACDLFIVESLDAVPESLRAAITRPEDGARVARYGSLSVSDEIRKRLAVGAEGGVCLVRRPARSAAAFYYNHFQPLVLEWLARRGVLMVHAGAAQVPGVGTVLICGDRFAGKTTTCLALLCAGRAVLTDDMVLIGRDRTLSTILQPLHPDGRLPEAWNLRSADAAPLPALSAGRVDLPADEHFPTQIVDTLPWPTAIVLPRVEGAHTSASPVGPVERARVLLNEAYCGVPPVAPELLHRLAALAETPAIRLTIGTDAFASPTVLTRALEAGLGA